MEGPCDPNNSNFKWQSSKFAGIWVLRGVSDFSLSLFGGLVFSSECNAHLGASSLMLQRAWSLISLLRLLLWRIPTPTLLQTLERWILTGGLSIQILDSLWNNSTDTCMHFGYIFMWICKLFRDIGLLDEFSWWRAAVEHAGNCPWCWKCPFCVCH